MEKITFLQFSTSAEDRPTSCRIQFVHLLQRNDISELRGPVRQARRAVFGWRPDGARTTPGQRPDNAQTTPRQRPDNAQTTPRVFVGVSQVGKRIQRVKKFFLNLPNLEQHSGRYLGVIWALSGRYPGVIWALSGRYPAVSHPGRSTV